MTTCYFGDGRRWCRQLSTTTRYSGGASGGGLFGYVDFCTLFGPKDIMELEKRQKIYI